MGGRLSEEEIERMVKEAEEFAEKEKIGGRNSLEGYAYNMRNQINDEEKLGGKISAEDKETIEEAVTAAIDWLDEQKDAGKEEYDTKLKELEAKCNPIVEKIYKESGGAPG